jgi:hypothetical protein
MTLFLPAGIVFTEMVNSRMVSDPEVIQMGTERIGTDKSACRP